jgi:hypothetical protein
MNAQGQLKKAIAIGLTAVMVLGGASSAFADGKGKGRDKDDEKQSAGVQINGNHNVNIVLNFNDIKGGDVEWAVKNITSMAARHVFEGYEDGSFQPRKPITHIEAITAAVRLMGLEDQAKAKMNTELNFSDASKISSKYSWAVGYVAVAAENDLFLETDDAVHPEQPADRLWATILLVKALKLNAEAKAAMNAHLPFADSDKIPAGAVGYVKVALDKGLINGYENNTFRPNQPVTRAELAALLDRTGDQIPDSGTMTGKVSAAVTGNSVTIIKDGVTVTVPIDANAYIFRDGVKVAATALQVGDELKIRTYNNAAIFIDVVKNATQQPPQQNTFTVTGSVYSTVVSQGVLTQITINQSVVNNGTTTVQQVTYGVAANATLTPAGAQLVQNQNVELKGANNIVTAITLK